MRRRTVHRGPPTCPANGILIVMKTLEQWDEFVSDRYDPNRKIEDFRKFDESAPEGVREFYRLNHTHQTREFVLAKKRQYAAKGVDVSIVRPPTILGHGRLGIFQLLFEWIHKGSNIPVLDGGKNTFQFIHADDLADACILASQRKGAEVYNCGTDRYGTMREALEHLCRFAGTGSRVRFSQLMLNPSSAFTSLSV